MSGADPASEVEVLFFQIGADQLGVDASQVLRIERPDVPGALRSPLGSPSPKRSLVFRTDGGEGALEVDLVHGVRTIPVGQLRRVPAAAPIARHAVGFWLDGGRPVLLIDLPRTLQARVSDNPTHASQRKAT